MPELRHFRYFVAVAEELNFSRAAKRLEMTQPPLSAAIRQLERELGAPLFVRTSREVRLTEAGRVFLNGARRALAEAERAAIAAQRAGSGELGHLRLAFSWSARFETLPTLGRAFRARSPEVELLTEEMWNARMAPALRAGAIDVAISLCPDLGSDVSSEVIRTEPVVALLTADHADAGAREIPLRSLAGEEFVLFPRELAPGLHDALVGVCRRAGFEPRLRKGSFHTGWDLRSLADTSVVALAPRSVSGGDLPDGVVALALTESTDRLESHLLWRSGERSGTVEAFRAVARDVYGVADSPSR